MNDAVGIVIPVRDRASLIGRCLDSVWAQTRRPLHVVVVDNDSSDTTIDVVREWGERHGAFDKDAALRLEILSEKKPGACAARNLGLRHVDTPYLLFFDSDDEMHPTLVEDAIEAIGDADLVYWRGTVVGLDGKSRPKPFYKGNLLARQIYNCLLSTQLYMARTEVFRRVGGWDEAASAWNDWELGIRIAMSDVKAVALDKELVTIHAQRKSITGTGFLPRRGEWENTLAIIERRVTESGFASAKKVRLRQMLAYRRMILAVQYRKEGDREAAEELLREACSAPVLGRARRALLRLLYHYTLRGGRAAYLLW